MIFINKPTILILHDDISFVSVFRLGESTQRFFEITIHTKKGEKLEFNNIEKKEYDPLSKYFNDKKISITSEDQDDNIEGRDILITKKVRKAPDMVDMELASEEESAKDDSFTEEDDYDFSESGESNKKKKDKKKDKKSKHKKEKKDN